MKYIYRNAGFSIAKLLFLLIIILAIGFGLLFFQQKQSEQEDTRQFITEPARRGEIVYTVNASGMVYPKKIVEVGAQVSGEIARLAVEIGDEVQAGDVIAEIDARIQENAKKTAEAQLQSQRASLSTAQSQLNKAQADFNRSDRLFKTGADSKENHDAMYTTLVSAKNAVAEVRARIRQSELTIENSEVDLSYTRVTAPISGIVIAVPVEEGQAVNAAQSSPTLVMLAQTDVMTVKAEIAEADISVIRAGLPVTFKLLGKNSDTFHASLRCIDPAPTTISDDGTMKTGTSIYYYGHIDADNQAGKLRYGMTALVSIEVDKSEDALLIPMTAVQLSEGDKAKVSILVDDQIVSRDVVLGLDDGVHVQVLQGLKEGDEVIIDQLNELNNLEDIDGAGNL